MSGLSEILQEYQALQLDEIIDHERFNQYAIVHHSTGIEGSTLTETETRLLLEEGITPKGKPLEHSLMVKDHYEALLFVLKSAKEKVQPDSNFICKINAKVLSHTGGIYNTALGEIDASKGMFRKGNVHAGNSYFMSYDKVELKTQQLAEKIREGLPAVTDDVMSQLELAFSAHFDLVTIHPFYDGNGRTSRLLMNYIQAYFNLPLAIVYKEDKADYFEALQQTRLKEDISIFTAFMNDQYIKLLQAEILQYKKDLGPQLIQKKNKGKGRGFSLFY